MHLSDIDPEMNQGARVAGLGFICIHMKPNPYHEHHTICIFYYRIKSEG